MAALGRPIHLRMVNSFRKSDRAALRRYAGMMAELIADLDELVGTNELFLTGRWVAGAIRWGNTAEEKKLYEYNARTLISTWWPLPLMFDDYAHKQWSGMLKNYYLYRWNQFAVILEANIDDPAAFDDKTFDRNIRDWEIGWMNATGDFAVEPSGDTLEVTRRMYAKYAPIVESFWSLTQ